MFMLKDVRYKDILEIETLTIPALQTTGGVTGGRGT